MENENKEDEKITFYSTEHSYDWNDERKNRDKSAESLLDELENIEYPCVILSRSNWNDYGYTCTFACYLKERENKKECFVGDVKIIKKGLGKAGTTNIPDNFKKLDNNYYSKISFNPLD